MPPISRFLIVLALAVTGCSAPLAPEIVEEAEAPAIAATPGIQVRLSEFQVEITSQPAAPEVRMVTYVILRPDNEKFILQLAGTGGEDGFPIGLSRKRFYRGKYEIRAHGDSAPEPFATTEWEFTGPSIADDLADSLQHGR